MPQAESHRGQIHPQPARSTHRCSSPCHTATSPPQPEPREPAQSSQHALEAYPARAGAPAAADGVEDLLAVVVERSQEHPPRKAVEALTVLEPFPKRLAPWEPRHQATGFRIRGEARQIELRPVSNREAHPFREML